MTNDDTNEEMPLLEDLPRDIFTKLPVKNREKSKIRTMFDVIWF